MRVLSGVVALALAACTGGESIKDTRGDSGSASSPPAVAEPSTQGASATAAAPSSAAPTVLIVGTSLTAGLGLDPRDAYPAVLQRMADSAGYKVRIVNAGLSGETSAGALRRLDWLLRDPADVVVIETGANDGLRGLDPDSTRANLAAIVRKVKSERPSTHILLVQMEAPPNLGSSYTTRFHDMYANVAEAEGAELLPFLLEGVAGDRRLNQADGMHPSAEGARIVARNLWPALAPVLQQLSRQT